MYAAVYLDGAEPEQAHSLVLRQPNGHSLRSALVPTLNHAFTLSRAP